MKDLPEDVRTALVSALPEVVAEVVAAIAGEVPGYRGRRLEGDFGEGVRRGVGLALERFLAAPTATAGSLGEAERAVYEELGRGELRQGRSLDALLSAYRVGARVAFRRLAAAALAAGLPGEALVPLAEATFAHIDQLSAASTAGWADEQTRRAGRLDRQRQALLDDLLSGTPDADTARAAADALGWSLPDRLVVVAVRPEHADGLALRLGAAALVGSRAEQVVALVPAGDPAVLRRLQGTPCALSPDTGWDGLPAALRAALLGLRLPALDGPVRVEERLGELLLVRDPALLQALVARRLAPLQQARPGSRERLAETLLAWLAHRGARQAVADALHLHPQTVAYRLGVLRELFGEALEDPDARFELELALRGARLTRG